MGTLSRPNFGWVSLANYKFYCYSAHYTIYFVINVSLSEHLLTFAHKHWRKLLSRVILVGHVKGHEPTRLPCAVVSQKQYWLLGVKKEINAFTAVLKDDKVFCETNPPLNSSIWPVHMTSDAHSLNALLAAQCHSAALGTGSTWLCDCHRRYCLREKNLVYNNWHTKFLFQHPCPHQW